MGQVPVLEVESDEGPVFITQSLAISEYLEERFPNPPLLGQSPLERARVREVTSLVTSGIQPLHNMRTLQAVAELGGKDSVTLWMERAVSRGLDALEATARQTTGPYMLGSSVTLADVFVAAQLDFVRLRDVLDLARYPALQRVETACLQLDAFANPLLPA
jgi:maleylacetoacetate isomerase